MLSKHLDRLIQITQFDQIASDRNADSLWAVAAAVDVDGSHCATHTFSLRPFTFRGDSSYPKLRITWPNRR